MAAAVATTGSKSRSSGRSHGAVTVRAELAQSLDERHARIARGFLLLGGDTFQRRRRARSRGRATARTPSARAPRSGATGSPAAPSAATNKSSLSSPQQPAQRRQGRLAHVVVVVQRETLRAWRRRLPRPPPAAAYILHLPALVAGERRHDERRAIGRPLGQRDERVRLAVPVTGRQEACALPRSAGRSRRCRPCTGRRARRARKAKTFGMLIGERGEHAAAACSGHAAPHPALQRLEPDHRSAIGKARLAGDRARRGRRRSSRRRRPARASPAGGPRRSVVIQPRPSGCASSIACAAISAANGVAAQIGERARSRADGHRPQPVQRDVLERQQLPVAPRERLETAQRRRPSCPPDLIAPASTSSADAELPGGGVREVAERAVRAVGHATRPPALESTERADRPAARPRSAGPRIASDERHWRLRRGPAGSRSAADTAAGR